MRRNASLFSMKKGIILLKFGKRGYGFAAYNLAYSIKHFSDLPITLYCDSIDEVLPEDRAVFDEIKELPFHYYTDGNRIDPGKAKLSVYDLLPYDYNLFLDVDTLALQDISPLMDELVESGKYYSTIVFASADKSSTPSVDSLFWAKASDVFLHFQLPEETVLPVCNSSVQFIKKSEEAKSFFHTVKELYQHPFTGLQASWGGTQPDELYLNVAMSKHDITDGLPLNTMFFGRKLDPRPTTQLQKDFYFLSIYGGQGYVRLSYTEWYDNLLKTYHRPGKHKYRYRSIVADKHANSKVIKMVKPVSSAKPPLELMINDPDYKP